MIPTENLIIGAGPGGLAVAGRLAHLRQPFEIIEQATKVGSMWHEHYDRLHLHTAKELSALPHLPYPAEYPLYVPKNQFIEYLEAYARHFQIRPHFEERCLQIIEKDGAWETTTSVGRVFRSKNVIIATGYNRVPVEPKWDGMETFEGTIEHSRFYKNGNHLKGKKVLVIGMGNTGAELAIDLHECGAIPFISVRDRVNIVKRDFNGKPTQYTAITLSKLPTWLYDFLSVQLQKFTVGDLSEFGLRRSSVPPSRQLREFGKTPIIDLGTVGLIRQGKVKILPAVQCFHAKSVEFTDGQVLPFDAVILATGYLSKIEDFLTDPTHALNHLGHPKSPVIPERKGLYFIGFGAYSSGILRNIHINSETIVQSILQR